MNARAKGPFGSWKWQTGADRYEVMLHRDSLYWYWEGPKDQGGGASQSFADFFTKGPLDRDIPDATLAALHAALAARGIRPGSPAPPQTEVTAARPVDRHEPEETSAERSGPTDTADDRRIVAAGLGIIVIGTLAAGLLAKVIPFWGGFAAALPLLAGLAGLAIYRSALMVVAGVLGLASAIAVVTALPLYLSAQKVQPPAFSADLRMRTDLSATHDFMTTRQSGASRVQQSNRMHAAPLAIANWSTRQPIGLWVVCATSAGFTCLPAQGKALSYVRPVRREDTATALAAIRNAVAAHQLALADRPRIVEPANPLPALRLAVGAPIGACLLFGLAAFWKWRRDRTG